MKMFSRDMILTGPPVDVRTWAVEIAAAFGDVTGRAPEVWACIAGGTIGHYSWTMQVDGSAEIVEKGMTALANEAYLKKVEEGRQFFVGLPKDTLYSPYNDPGEYGSEPGNVAIVTTADSKAGSLGHAVGWGLEAAEYVSRITDIPVALMGQSAGAFSRLSWIGIAENAAQADAFDDATSGDDEYLKLIARGGGYFISGSAHTRLFLRIG